jgi:hypothetical protein
LTVLRPALSSYLHVLVPVLMKLIDAIAAGGAAGTPTALRWQVNVFVQQRLCHSTASHASYSVCVARITCCLRAISSVSATIHSVPCLLKRVLTMIA